MSIRKAARDLLAFFVRSAAYLQLGAAMPISLISEGSDRSRVGGAARRATKSILRSLNSILASAKASGCEAIPLEMAKDFTFSMFEGHDQRRSSRRPRQDAGAFPPTALSRRDCDARPNAFVSTPGIERMSPQ